MKRLLHILFWSVISAAFIGPGTVTTAAAAGARYGLALIWALVFSTATCLVLQEAAARLTVVSGRDLGAILRERGARWLPRTTGATVILGCAAYEAGNILGGVAGIRLLTPGSSAALATLCVVAAAVLLWFASTRFVARLLGMLVAGMGIVFLVTAVSLGPSLVGVVRGAVIPTVPREASPLIVGLVGTTVVPYNLFLGSSLARGYRLADLRLGLSVAIPLGGLISIAVLVVGTALPGRLEFAPLATVLQRELGVWAGVAMGLGLFAAGFSSAITAPLAASLTARSTLGNPNHPRWRERGLWSRAVWLGVLLVGWSFGVSDVKPIPVIILAQIFNGLLLPFVAIILFIAVNDRRLMGNRVNPGWLNVMTALVVMVTVMLGLSSVGRAVARVIPAISLSPSWLLLAAVALTLGVAWPVSRVVRAVRTRPLP